MAKFNVVQKQRRQKLAEMKRSAHGDPITRKLKSKPQPSSLSGKRKQKLFKKWRREQKEGLEHGLDTMEDIEMAVAGGTSHDSTGASHDLKKKAPVKIHLKKGGRLRIKKLRNKEKNKGGKNNRPPTSAEIDAMVE